MKILDKFFKKDAIVDEIADESGAGTAFALTFAFVCIGIGGLSIDAANVWSTKQRLQAATDIAAHATAVDLVWPGYSGFDGTPAEVAIAAIKQNMPASKYGVSVQPSDVHLAYWDAENKELTNSATTASGDERLRAVAVTARLDGEVGNVVPTFILKLIGFDYWKTATSAVFVRDTPTCFYGGFIANVDVDIAANARFDNKFCIHANGVGARNAIAVDAQSHIYFGDGVRVTMPDSKLADDGGMFNLVGTDHTWVEGMENQVADDYISTNIATPASLEATFNDLIDPYNPDLPNYITKTTVNKITARGNNPVTQADIVQNAINIIDCRNNGIVLGGEDTIINEVIIVANCPIRFGKPAQNTGDIPEEDQQIHISDAIIVTSFSGSKAAMQGRAHIQIGADDHCAKGGGVSLMTMGSVNLAADNEWYGSEVIASGDISIAAQSDGIEGASFITNGSVKAAANLGFGTCVGGIDHYKELYFVRMVR